MKQKIPKIIIGVLVIIFVISGVFYYLVLKKIVNIPFVSNYSKKNASQTKPPEIKEPQFHQTDVTVQSVDLTNKLITGEILLVSKDFPRSLQESVSVEKNDLIKKRADLKVNLDTVFSGISLEKIKSGDHVIVETKENLFNYTEGTLNLSSVKKR